MMDGEMDTKKNELKDHHKQIRMPVETNLDQAFPLRKDLPITVHKQVSDSSGTRAMMCVYCSWLYNQTDKDMRGEWSKVMQ